MINNNNKRKVSIIGCGCVGATIAYALMIKDLVNEIVLIDVNEAYTVGESLDIRHGISYMGLCYIHPGEYKDVADSDLIIITAGRNRRPDETRLDMAADNVLVAKNICEELKKYYTSGVILVVTNPVDIITAKVKEFMGLPDGVVFGTGCILDSSRFTYLIAEHLQLSPRIINAQIIGEHGNNQIAMWSKVNVSGMPLEKFCSSMNVAFNEDIKKQIEKEVSGMGTEIIKRKGRTHYGIATCVCYIADSILNNRSTIASVSCYLNGQYGVDGVALSVPCIISSVGVERVIEEELSDAEKEQFLRTAGVLKKYLEEL